MNPKFQISLVAFFLMIAACAPILSGSGLEGRYLKGKDEFLSGRAGDTDKALATLESVVREDPTYKDSLTLLGRGYYRKERYQEAKAILQRAVAVNKNDAIAWLALALSQLRLGEDQAGLENLNRAIIVLSRASVPGYGNSSDWDSKGLVRSAIQRTTFLAANGLKGKQNLIRSADTVLIRIDDEESFQHNNSKQEYRRVYTGSP